MTFRSKRDPRGNLGELAARDKAKRLKEQGGKRSTRHLVGDNGWIEEWSSDLPKPTIHYDHRYGLVIVDELGRDRVRIGSLLGVEAKPESRPVRPPKRERPAGKYGAWGAF